LPPIAFGIGIDSCPGLAGLMGSRERREYAVIGHPVNLAAMRSIALLSGTSARGFQTIRNPARHTMAHTIVLCFCKGSSVI
jgi:class 3 adenylate cyclase